MCRAIPGFLNSVALFPMHFFAAFFIFNSDTCHLQCHYILIYICHLQKKFGDPVACRSVKKWGDPLNLVQCSPTALPSVHRRPHAPRPLYTTTRWMHTAGVWPASLPQSQIWWQILMEIWHLRYHRDGTTEHPSKLFLLQTSYLS